VPPLPEEALTHIEFFGHLGLLPYCPHENPSSWACLEVRPTFKKKWAGDTHCAFSVKDLEMGGFGRELVKARAGIFNRWYLFSA
jgi:hypothetical protein